MRADFHKVITERPRYGHTRSYHDVRHRKCPLGRGIEDGLPHCEGMRCLHALQRQTKSLSDRLGPLRRFLDQEAGRSWNTVFSEFGRVKMQPQAAGYGHKHQGHRKSTGDQQ